MICFLLGHKFWFSYYPGGPRHPAEHCRRCGKKNT